MCLSLKFTKIYTVKKSISLPQSISLDDTYFMKISRIKNFLELLAGEDFKIRLTFKEKHLSI